MDRRRVEAFVERTWEEKILPVLSQYITIPNKSPDFDPQWAEHGHMDRAVDLLAGWAQEREVEGLSLEVVRLPGRTPLIYMEIPGEGDHTALLSVSYTHLTLPTKRIV